MNLLANVDNEGNITQSTYGEYVVDLEGNYEHHLKITEEQAENLQDYKIVNGKLINAE